MKFSLAALLLTLPAVAAAQDPADLRLSDGYADIDETMVSDPDLNVEACFAEAATRISFDITYTGTTVLFLEEPTLSVWLEASSDSECVGQIPGNGESEWIGELELATDDIFLTSGALIRVPDDIEDDVGSTPVLTTESLLELRSACPEGDDETVTVCIGLDLDNNNSIDETLSFDPHGWVRVSIDTSRPPKPDVPTIRPLDGRLRITAKISGDTADKDDVVEYKAFGRPEPADEAERGVACDLWGDVSGLRTATVDTASGGSQTFEMSARNGVTYEICVYAVDDAGNFSVPSDLATGTPQQECDFIECYPPGLLESGCSATGGTPLAGLCVLLLVLRRARERRE